MFKLRRHFILLSSFLAASLAAMTLLINIANANSGSVWLAPSNLSLQKQVDLTSIPESINGNTDCFAQANGVCAVTTEFGTADTSGAVRLANTNTSLPVYSYIDNHQHFIAIPNSNTVMSYTTEPPYGFYLYFNYNFSSIIKKLNNGLGDYYQVSRPPDGQLTDRAGHRLAADYTSISFSENGRWMVVSEPNIAMLRVDLQTFEVLPFGPGFDYAIGLDPAPQTAITNDGRYAVIASKDFNRFSLYDLSSCAIVPLAISGPVSCQSRDLQDFMVQQISGYIAASNIRFVGNNALSLYAGYLKDGQPKTSKYILSPSGSIIHQQDYLALGDSYISGEGAFEYLPGTDTSDNQCHVSAVSYPLLLGQELNYNAYHSIACSGATSSDIINTSRSYTGQIKNAPTREELEQGNGIPSILSNFQPGYIDQLDFVSQYQPKIITLSVGGDDIGFSSIVRTCTVGVGTCYGSYEDRLEIINEINSKVFPRLVQTYQKLKTAGAPDARIYAIGYPQIAKPDGNCALNVHLNNQEVLFSQQLIEYLDSVIKQAAARAGVFYVDTQNALKGHRLCEASPGSVAMNGISAGNDFPELLGGPLGRESYHPNAFGHQLLENEVLLATHNLTAPMPVADLNASPAPTAGLDILNAPHSGRAVDTTEFDPGISADLAFQQVPLDVTIEGAPHSLAASATLQAELHSTPTSLGSFTTDATGNLNAQITVPSTVPAGYHSLHFYGTDISGQAVDIYKMIYVATTADDLDGNGALDSTQKCVGVEPSGEDFDQDGIDDACDGNIMIPATTSSEPTQVSGSLSSQTDNLEVSSSASSSETSGPTNIAFAEQNSPNTGRVLAAHTSAPTYQPKIAQTNLRIPSSYFESAGLGVFILSALAYVAKIWLF